MLSKKVLELVMYESETMMIEWALMGGPGFSVIDEKIDDYFLSEGYGGHNRQQKLKANVRKFIKEDMTIMGW